MVKYSYSSFLVLETLKRDIRETIKMKANNERFLDIFGQQRVDFNLKKFAQ